MQYELLKRATQLFSDAYAVVMDHFVAPPFCAYCKIFLNKRMIFCIECLQMIEPIVSVQVSITQQHAITVLSISDYDEPLKTLILAKSWSDILASKQLGQLIWELTYFKHMPCDYLIPVPLHWIRHAKRGYNQAEEIAKVLAQHKNIPVATIVSRQRNTPFQSSLAFDQRLANVKNAFCLNTNDEQKYCDKHLMIVDDLMTTGSTLASVAKVLAPLKPASITAIVVCRVV